MKHGQFDRLLKRRLMLTESVLTSKNAEYASDSDKLRNFKRAGEMLHCTPEKALMGMWTKHIISILDIVDQIDNTRALTIKMLEEKIGDAINYLILLEALIKERY